MLVCNWILSAKSSPLDIEIAMFWQCSALSLMTEPDSVEDGTAAAAGDPALESGAGLSASQL